MFANLPTRQVPVDTLTEEEKTCPVCGTDMVPIGHEVIRTEIRYTEPKLERIDYIATTYECPKCKETENPQFIKDEGEPALIPGSYASSGLAAHVMYAKYVLSLPLLPSEKRFRTAWRRVQPYNYGALDHLLCTELFRSCISISSPAALATEGFNGG